MAARPPVKTKKKQDISSFHTYAVFLSLDLTMPSLLARSLYTHNMCPLFAYAGYAAVRAPIETKKKRDMSSFNTYTVFLTLDLTLPSLLARFLYTDNMCPLFAYAGYTAARALVEAKKNRDLSSFHTYAVLLSLGLIF
jgi:uncharacterized membrane protein